MRDFISRRNVLRAGAAFSVGPFLLGGVAIAEDEPVRDYDAHVAKLRERFPEETYAILIEKPFVVIGDMPAKSVQPSLSMRRFFSLRRFVRY